MICHILSVFMVMFFFFFFKQKTAYEMRISDWSSDVCSSDLALSGINGGQPKTYLTEAFYNMGYDFGGIELYSFGDYARRIGYAKQGYRHPKRICYETGNLSGGITPAAYNPNICYSNTGTWGMVPLQHVIEDEYSFTVGAKGEASGWNYDLSTTYGYQKDDIWTEASAHRRSENGRVGKEGFRCWKSRGSAYP